MKVEICDQTVNSESYVSSHAAGRILSWNGTAWSYRQGRLHAGRCSARVEWFEIGWTYSFQDGWRMSWGMEEKIYFSMGSRRSSSLASTFSRFVALRFLPLGLHEVQNLRHFKKDITESNTCISASSQFPTKWYLRCDTALNKIIVVDWRKLSKISD